MRNMIVVALAVGCAFCIPVSAQEDLDWGFGYNTPDNLVTSGETAEFPVRAVRLAGIEGTVDFSITALPQGVDAEIVSVAPSSFNAYVVCQATLRIEVAPGAPAGAYTIGIRGVGNPGEVERTMEFTLVVVGDQPPVLQTMAVTQPFVRPANSRGLTVSSGTAGGWRGRRR